MDVVIACFAQSFFQNRRAQATVIDDDDSHLTQPFWPFSDRDAAPRQSVPGVTGCQQHGPAILARTSFRRIINMDMHLIALPQRSAFRKFFVHAFDHSLSFKLVRA
jgi:hypothetical protein